MDATERASHRDTGAALSSSQRLELAGDWRERAARLEATARTLRREGLAGDAEDLEGAARDYHVAADELDLGAELGRSR
jgi:hypothetical protein